MQNLPDNGLDKKLENELEKKSPKDTPKDYILLITQSEEQRFIPLPFKSIHPMSGANVVRKNIILDNYANEVDWLAECQAIPDAGDRIKELHCFANMANYGFLSSPVFCNIYRLFLYEAEALEDLDFLENMPNLNALLIDGAFHLAEEDKLNALADYLKKQEEEHKKWRKAFDKKSEAERFQDIFHFPFLDALCIRRAGISDLSSFEGLSRPLHEIDFSYNQLEDITPLAGLVCNHLFLGHNQICRGFAEVVARMVYPIDIAVRHNRITDEELAHMLELMKGRELIHIYIKHNFITDYTGLKKMNYSRSDIEDAE